MLDRSRQRPAIFFDRDGVINVDEGYIGTRDRFRLLPGAAIGLRLANEVGVLCFLVTNQSGIARGLYSESELQDTHKYMNDLLMEQGARFDDIRYCPHLVGGKVSKYSVICDCRKPKPGMVLELLTKWPEADPCRSALIGDKPTDMKTAIAAGISGFLGGHRPLVEVVQTVLRWIGT